MRTLTPILVKNEKTVFTCYCQFCNGKFSNYAVRRHEKMCYLNPKIVVRIIEYLDLCVVDPNMLMKKRYNRYALDNGLPNIATIMLAVPAENRRWNQVASFLILKLYEHEFITDIENYDQLIKITTLNTYGKDGETEKAKRLKYVNEQDLDLTENYNKLFYAVVSRSIKDYLSPRKYSDDGEFIDRDEILEFLKDVYPKALGKIERKRKKLQTIS